MDFLGTLRDILERTSKPGLLGLAGRSAEKRCAADLADYFKSLGKRIIALGLQNVAAGQPNAEIAQHAAEMQLNNVLRERSVTLLAIFAVNIQAAYLLADKQVVLAEAATVEQQQLDKLGPRGKEAAAYASRRAAELVKDINTTTRKQIAKAIGEAITERSGVAGALRSIREIVDSMSKARAETIATTEMNDAMSEASLQKIKRLKIEYKQLILSDDACPVCQSIYDAGPVPVDEPFVDDDGEEYDRTPIHPHCRCATTGARAPEGDDEDE